jgi:aldehyde decarbonylase
VLSWQNEAINRLIEQAILEAEEKGVKVISLGLLNQVIFYYFFHQFTYIFSHFIPFNE